ncbi:MAG: DUF86 domain-containing protein [Gammaproteobacteria bacterium]
MDDVILNKVASIERCLERIAEEYSGNLHELQSNQTRQDAVVLNLLRACETTIDLALHVVRKQKLGVPGSSREAFDLLVQQGYLDQDLAVRLKRMVGFRNIAIHRYQEMSLEILQSILDERLDDFRAFNKVLLQS